MQRNGLNGLILNNISCLTNVTFSMDVALSNFVLGIHIWKLTFSWLLGVEELVLFLPCLLKLRCTRASTGWKLMVWDIYICLPTYLRDIAELVLFVSSLPQFRSTKASTGVSYVESSSDRWLYSPDDAHASQQWKLEETKKRENSCEVQV